MAVKPAPVPIKIAATPALCSQKHTAASDADTTQFNMDKQQFTSICHECQMPFGTKAASSAK